MEVRFTDEGIHLPALDLWLDPEGDRGAAWISHAHADHARGRHGLAIATPETLAIHALRQGAANEESRALRPGERMRLRGATLSAHPASHILGSAMLLVEHAGERLLYTGDVKLRPPILGTETAVPPCDRLIVESTFGLPIFHLLGREEAKWRIVAFARACLEEGETPVFLGYALGRGQELAHTLCAAGIPTAVHGAIARLVPFYEAAGYGFPGLEGYDRGRLRDRALVVVPTFRSVLQAMGGKLRFAFVSGWAALANARARTGAEELIPWSDHADWEELHELVDRSGAREIDVVHGYAEAFAGALRGRGLEARAPRRASARHEELEP